MTSMKRKEPVEPSANSPVKNVQPKKMNRIEDNTTVESTNGNQKYDRQLRLWGDDGQKALSNASVCLLNATATGSEVLKCLVLPGVGKFSIVDGGVVTDEDAGCNFFVDVDSSVGKPRAQVICKNIQELNSDCTGHYFVEKPIDMLNNDPEFFKKFSVVIASRLSEHDLSKFSSFLWHCNVPFVICDTLGFLGYLRISHKEHVVVESHPDNTFDDLRLHDPFPELVAYFNSIDLQSMDHRAHSHTPFLIILYKFLQEWRQANNNAWPKLRQEKKEIEVLIRQGMQRNSDGTSEENFDEAIQKVNTAFSISKVPSSIDEYFKNQKCLHPDGPNIKFWILLCALKEYTSQYNGLPLRGSLPDMFSDSKTYIDLQNLYKAKANHDIELFKAILEEALQDLQLEPSFIGDDEVRLFCKNAAFLRIVKGRALHDELKGHYKVSLDAMQDDFSSVYMAIRSYYMCLNSSDKIEENIAKAEQQVCALLESTRLSPNEYLCDLSRTNFGEVHTVASTLGGICAQEVIKLITKQFVPIDNTYLYNGITCTTCTIK